MVGQRKHESEIKLPTTAGTARELIEVPAPIPRPDRTGTAVLNRLIAIALAIETLLVCVEGSIAASTRYLPIGGSHLAQLGFVLGLAVVVTHLWCAVQKP